MIHNEDSRVKTPSILHLIKLGYGDLSPRDTKWDLDKERLLIEYYRVRDDFDKRPLYKFTADNTRQIELIQ